MKKSEHTFVICAYKESPFLEECVVSLKRQTVPSIIKVVTSTPNNYIKDIASRYKIEYIINNGKKGISEDWNFAYRQAQTRYVTIAHQDDVYAKNYTKRMLVMFSKVKRPLLFFSDYAELRDGEVYEKNELLSVKRIMLLPLRLRVFWNSRFVRRRILSMGSPICCPSVCYCKPNLPGRIFESGFRSCEDWEAWEKLSKYKGAFVYDKEILMYHRIHEGSETTAIIQDNQRSDEELIMYKKFWPDFIAKRLVRVYARGQKSNGIS